MDQIASYEQIHTSKLIVIAVHTTYTTSGIEKIEFENKSIEKL